MGGKEILRILSQNGWQIIRVKGSHHHLFHPQLKKNVTIPVHGKKDLKFRTLRSIEKSTGVRLRT
jgi:predicted RNA binding protein YcfA (HicA-like mRNA interferase family)